MKRSAITSGLALLMSLAVAGPVLAAPPTNDTWAGRTSMAALPFSETLDTSEATTDADDDEAAADCGEPALTHSVWYEISVSNESFIAIDASESDYPVGIIVVTGAPGSFSLVDCGPFALGFSAAADETYSLLLFDFALDSGGMLELSVFEAPPPPEIEVTVDPIGNFHPRTGSATIRGTVTCSGDAEDAFIDVELRQRVGRFIITGFGFVEFACDGSPQVWEVEIVASNGSFKGGSSVAVVFAVACGFFDCGSDFEEVTVRLRR